MTEKQLTPKQARFVEEYLIDLNATQAAIRAGYSPKTARQIAEENLSKPNIHQAISKAQDKRSKRTEITQDMVLAELAKIAFTNMADFAQWGPNGITLMSSEELTREAAAAVAEIQESTNQAGGTTLKFKRFDKIKALELLGRHLGIFDDKLSVDLRQMSDAELLAALQAFATGSKAEEPTGEESE
jgi:phage terminase small subunit